MEPMDDSDTNLTPLGRLLEQARAAAGLSQNEAARRAGASGTAWRRIITGRAKINGVEVDFPGKPLTVAKMAGVVQLDPGDVETVGERPDVAAEMRALAEQPPLEKKVIGYLGEAQQLASVPSEATEDLAEIARLLAESSQLLAELRTNVETKKDPLTKRQKRVVRQYADAVEAIKDELGDVG